MRNTPTRRSGGMRAPGEFVISGLLRSFLVQCGGKAAIVGQAAAKLSYCASPLRLRNNHKHAYGPIHVCWERSVNVSA